MDKAARARQVSGCIAHAGDAFTFTAPGAAAVPFSANLQEEPLPADADKTRLGAQPARQIRLTASLTKPDGTPTFGARLPRVGEDLVGETGHHYRITALPEPPTRSTISFLCTVSAPRA